jgi:hypothetical protein
MTSRQTGRTLLACASFAFAISVSDTHANLIQNGGFEIGDYNNFDSDPRTYIMLVGAGSQQIPGWSVNGSYGVHWLDGELAADPTWARDGKRSLDLQGENPESGPLSSVETNFATQPNARYRLSFEAYRGNRDNSASVSVGSLQNQLFSGGGPGDVTFIYEQLRWNFQATGVTSTMQFQVLATDGFGPVIDDVRVTLAGDFDASDSISPTDVDLLRAAPAGTTDRVNSIFDLDLNGAVISEANVVNSDLNILVQQIAGTQFGDADLDRDVDFSDLLTLAQNYGTPATEWASCNFDGMAGVEFGDLLMLAQSYGFGIDAGPKADFAFDWYRASLMVPEPLSLTSVALLMSLRLRCRNSSQRGA